MKKYLITLILVMVGFLLPAQQNLAPKDLVIVLDVSLSMVGKGSGNNNIFEQVKEEAVDIIKKLNIGDTVMLVKFGTYVEQGDRIPVRSEEDRLKLIETVRNAKAKSLWTHTSLMFKHLSKTIGDINKESPDRVQLALIFSDAKDDPPLNSQKLELLEKAERCVKESDPGKRYIFYLSVVSELNPAIIGNLVDCFPEAEYYQMKNSGGKNSDSIQGIGDKVMSHLIPKVELSSIQEFVPKPGSSFNGELLLTANKAAEGIVLNPKAEALDEDLSDLRFNPGEITLVEGVNKIGYTVQVDLRPESGAGFTAVFESADPKISEQIKFEPGGSNTLAVDIQLGELAFVEKLSQLPEYYIPLVLLILLVLFGLYKLYKYLSFVPVLKMTYWLTPAEGDFRESDRKKLILKTKKGLKKGEPMPDIEFPEQDVFKEEINFLEIETVNYFIAPQMDSNGEIQPNLILDELAKNEIIHLRLLCKKRRTRIKAMGQWKKRIKRKERFNGSLLRNGTYFTYGPYSFEVETNLPR